MCWRNEGAKAMFWAKCIISIVWNGMKMGNGNSHCKSLYNYIEKLYSALFYLYRMICFSTDLDRSGKTGRNYKAERGSPR